MSKFTGLLLLVGLMALVDISSSYGLLKWKRSDVEYKRDLHKRDLHKRSDESSEESAEVEDSVSKRSDESADESDEIVEALFKRSAESDAAIEAEFRTHDKNNDGHLSYQELKATIPRNSGLTESQIRRTFNYLDTDNSNTLDLAEIKRMYEIVQG